MAIAASPASDEFEVVARRLLAEQGPVPALRPGPILDSVVGTVLSQHTSDANSSRAMASLRKRFPRWDEVLQAPEQELVDAIKSGGLAALKAPRIRDILAAVRAREGSLDLARLSTLPDQEVRDYLVSLPGVGPKTAACVLQFTMLRPAFPVDTHVHRVTRRLGWAPLAAGAAQTQALLEPLIRPDLRYPLHVALVRHGRTVCRAPAPRCEVCVLSDRCPRSGVLVPGPR